MTNVIIFDCLGTSHPFGTAIEIRFDLRNCTTEVTAKKFLRPVRLCVRLVAMGMRMIPLDKQT